MANIIYGINADGGFTDVIDTDAALKTLGLDPADLKTVNDISGYINSSQLHALSQVSGSPNTTLPVTAIDKVSQHLDATKHLAEKLESRATVARPTSTGMPTDTIKGNVIVNGPVGASAIRYFSTDLMNATTGELEPLDISTSRVSSWSRNGSTITYGGDLRISSVSPREAFDRGQHDSQHVTPKLGVGKIVIDGRVQKTTIAPRIFPAEQATHKLKVNINGVDTYLYAMKNIPLIFEGTFRGRGGSDVAPPIFETDSTSGGSDYRVITGISSENFFESAKGGDLRYPGRGTRGRTIEVYQAPAKLTLIKTYDDGLNITNFPNAEYNNLATLGFANNLLQTLPNFSKICPNNTLTDLNLSQNPLHQSPAGSNRSFNRLSLAAVDRLPTSLTKLNIANCFGPRGDRSDGKGVYSGDIKRQLPNLVQFTLGKSQTTNVNSPFYPEVPFSCKEVLYNELEGMQFPGVSQVKVIPLGDSYSRLDSDLTVKHNATLDVVDTGTVTKATKLKIRRSMNMFSIEAHPSPGAGYTAGSFVVTKPGAGTGGNTLANAVAGGFSPQGIPFGTVTITVDGSGGITGGTFLPHNSPDVFAKSNITIPTVDKHLTGSDSRSVQVHLGGSNYSPMGYYVDCGLFSSPLSLEKLEVSDTRSFTFHEQDAFTNPFRDSTSVNGLGNTATYSYSGVSVDVNKPDHDVYKSFNKIDARFNRGLVIPDYRGSNINSFNYQQANINDDLTSIVNRMKKLRDTIKVAPGLDCPTEAELAYIWGRGRTLYASPKDSPNQPAGEGGQSLIRGKNGYYKFANCTKLKIINCRDAYVGGTLPSFTGNNALQTIDLVNTFINRGEPGPSNSPLFLKLDAFDDCKDTLISFKFQTRYPKNQWHTDDRVLQGDMWGWHASNNGGATGYYAPASRGGNSDAPKNRVRIDPFPKCTLKLADSSTVDDTAIPPIAKDDSCFDRLGPSFTTCFIRTRSGQHDGRGARGLYGPVPTFKNATNLARIEMYHNSFGRDFDDNTIKESLGTGSMNFSAQYEKLNHIHLGINNISGNLSFQRMANGIDLGGTKHLQALKYFAINWNFLTGVDDWGPDGAQYQFLHTIHLSNSFQPPAGDYRHYDTTNNVVLPSMKNYFPKLQYLYMQGWSKHFGSGAITGFVEDGNQTFKGMTKIREIDLSYNKLSKLEIFNIIKSLRNLCRDEGVRGVTIKLGYQRDYDGVGGQTDFRMGISSDVNPFRIANDPEGNTNYYTDAWSITDGYPAGSGLQNTIEMNDLIEEVTNQSIYQCSLTGIAHSTIPPAPDAPTGLEWDTTGSSNNQLQDTRLTDPGSGYINLYAYPTTNIAGTLNVTGIDEDTETLNIKFINYRGIELTAYEINVTRNQLISDTGNTLKYSQPLTLPIDGQNEPINKFDTTLPYDLNTTLASDVGDYSNNKQSLVIVCTPSGYRGDGNPKITELQFINQQRYVSVDDSDYEGAREWRTLESS